MLGKAELFGSMVGMTLPLGQVLVQMFRWHSGAAVVTPGTYCSHVLLVRRRWLPCGHDPADGWRRDPTPHESGGNE
jgi:hypothetical protein